jgi:superfamily II DNA or RNA helicase
MAHQPPRFPTPLDLAQVRPRPAQPPPRNRRQAEREKDRARQELRALLADPAGGLAALSGDEFFAALKQACQDGTAHPALIADCERRITSREMGPRELHQVLFAASDRHEWGGVRALALAAAGQVPGTAIAVLGLEAQRLGVAPMHVTESAADGGFTATASLERDGARVEGQAGHGSSKKTARQAAALSLLAVLTGLAVPADDPSAAPRDFPDDPGLSPADLESWLDYEVARPSPDPELAAAVRPGKLTARSVCLLLFDADPRGWADARAAAWEALVGTPTMAGGVLSMYSQARGWPPARYIQAGERSALAFLPAPDGPVVGAPSFAATAKAARAGAALALLRDLAPAVQPRPADSGRTTAGLGPVAILNQRTQTGVISDLSYSHDASGPPHAPVFTCTASCVHATGSYTCAAEGRTKNEAKTAAAAGLLDQITEQDQSAAAHLARAAEAEARSAQGIFGRLLRAGCALDFRGRRFEVTDPAGAPLEGPLTGFTVPLLEALPVLATLDGPAADGGAASSHESARTWANAARSALEAVAARRVYPALDAEGRDCWRLAGSAADGGFADAVAEALLRPPGARLVIGDLPYAGRARVLDGDAAQWADRCAEAADPAPAAPMSLRVQPPASAGSPLTAELHAPRLGHPEHRVLRRAARDWPPLHRIRRDGTLGGGDAAELLGPAGDQLAAHGITVEWAGGLVLGLHASTIARPRSADGAFSLGGIADLAWQLALDGEPLSEAESEAVAAADGVARLRGRWVLIDPDTARRARERQLGELTGAQALGAALTGRITVRGQEVACAGAGRLADLVIALRDAGNDSGDPVEVPGGLHAALRGYQHRALRWLARTTELGFGALLADDMGLGKTLTVIAYHLHRARPDRAAGPTLVICPASLLANWEREFARFAPDVPVRRYHAASRSLDGLTAPEGPVVVTSYGTLLRDAGRLAEVPWGIVVADEAQQVKNHRSQAARALRALPAGARIAVTGTPVENSLSELWAILDWTNPGLFGTLAAFRERYGRAAEREAGGSAARRLGRLVSPFLMRRLKTDPDVAPELPEKVVSDRYVQLTREQAALYQAATADTLARIAASTGIARRGQVLRLLQSLRQICNSPAHFLRESAEEWDAGAQAARSGKLQVLEELMDSVAAAGDAALIFTGYVSMGHLIQAHLRTRGMPAGFLHGGVPVGKRQEMVDRFQSGDGVALILSVRAAGTGLNLTRAGHVIHFDRPWNPAVEDQATDRAHRIGQHRTVNVHHLIAEGTVEDRIAELLARKRGLTEAVLAGGETALTELDDGELHALVSLGQGAGGAA